MTKHDKNWTTENICVLIDLYQERPCLWKTKDPEYMNSVVKLVKLQEIVDTLGEPFTGKNNFSQISTALV